MDEMQGFPPGPPVESTLYACRLSRAFEGGGLSFKQLKCLDDEHLLLGAQRPLKKPRLYRKRPLVVCRKHPSACSPSWMGVLGDFGAILCCLNSEISYMQSRCAQITLILHRIDLRRRNYMVLYVRILKLAHRVIVLRVGENPDSRNHKSADKHRCEQPEFKCIFVLTKAKM